MKANELMIGDWVRNDLDEIQQVQEIRSDSENSVMLSYGDFYGFDEIEPIKLTPEILEKNGFIYKKLKGVGDNEIWRIEDDYYDIDIYEWSDSIWIFRYDCNEMSLPHTQVTMSYVHELQHAIRLCGISKEIEL